MRRLPILTCLLLILFARLSWAAETSFPVHVIEMSGTSDQIGAAHANQLGEPKSARAVARACATNPVSLIVPCHRVLRTDGSLGGYRWGLSRKVQLIGKEKESAS